ncbi:hypothetical protein LguiA_007930 [Lonicera macranthoides]
MASVSTISTSSILMLLSFTIFMSISSSIATFSRCEPIYDDPVPKEDAEMFKFMGNLEYLDAEFFLHGALGVGLDVVAPQLVMGGPSPIGARKANLDLQTHSIIEEFGYQQVGRLRALKSTVGLLPRPLLDLSDKLFAKVVDVAFGQVLEPPFDPYKNSLNFMLASFALPDNGLVGYVGANPKLTGMRTKRLLSGLLGVKSGQEAVIRGYLYERQTMVVEPYKFTVEEFITRLANLGNLLGKCGIKDEGLKVPLQLGAEKKTMSNVLSADAYSTSYGRTPEEILRILYATGNAKIPGGFFPLGANGVIAKSV